jgi:hypothetical protein
LAPIHPKKLKKGVKTPKLALFCRFLSGMFCAIKVCGATNDRVVGQLVDSIAPFTQKTGRRPMKSVKPSFNISTTQLSFSIAPNTYLEHSQDLEAQQQGHSPLAPSSKLRNLEGGNILIAQKSVRDLLDKYAEVKSSK